MKPFRLLLIVTFLGLSYVSSPAQETKTAPLVLRNVSLLTMEQEQIIEDQTVIIRQAEIVWTGNSDEAEIPENARIVQGEYYVMPGLAEMHAHIPPHGRGEQAMEDALVLYLSQGITTIRGMLGTPAHLDLREKAANGQIISPRIFTSGPSFSGNSVTGADMARMRVQEQAEAGYDLLKFHPGLTLKQFHAITDEAGRAGIEFSGHISHAVGLERSLNAGQGTIEHLDRYMEFLAGDPQDREDPSIIYFGYDLAYEADEARITEAVDKTVEAGTWNVATQTLLQNVFNPDLEPEMMKEWPGMKYMTKETVDNWAAYVTDLRNSEDYEPEKARRFLEIRDRLLLALHEGGAGLLLGADAPQIFNPPGFSAHRELGLYVDAGLKPFHALRTGTVNVAKYLGEDTSGIVAPGKRADLILLSSNPLESIPFEDKIEGVISNGIYYDRASLDQLLEEIHSRAHN